MHGKIINFNEINIIQPRNKWLNPDKHFEINNDIKLKKPLLFMPNDLWDDVNMQQHEYKKGHYHIVIFGALEDGQKATVILDDIYPYFDIKYDPIIFGKDNAFDEFQETILDKLNTLNQEEYAESFETPLKYASDVNLNIYNSEKTTGKPFLYFQEHENEYLRIFFYKNTDRVIAIKYIRNIGYETAHDDINNYHRVVCRDHKLTFSSWVKLNHYEVYENKYFKGSCFKVNVCNYVKFDTLIKDRIMSLCWDIETFKPLDEIESSEPPYPQYNKHVMFMISMTFQWYNENDQLLRVCLIDMPCDPHPDYLTIICRNEKNLIRAYIKICSLMMPDIIMGFNDSDYDWRWLIGRAEHYNIVNLFADMDMFKYPVYFGETDPTKKILKYYKKEKIKIDADTYWDRQMLHLHGYIPIDVMIIFKQLFPTDEKWSLNWFLTKHGLYTKLDMNFLDMFKAYYRMTQILKITEPSDAEKEEYIELRKELTMVAHYCIIDAQRCHELIKKVYVINDRREIANMSYTSMSDAIFRANGMKVRNLVIGTGQDWRLMFNNISVQNAELGKYPGAYVFPPQKGLVRSKLTLEERGITDKKEVIEFMERHNSIHFDKKDIGHFDEKIQEFLIEENQYPVAGLDFASLYPSIIMTYNLSPEYIVVNKQKARELSINHKLYRIEFEFNNRIIKGWVVWHDNKLDITKSDFKFGLFGYILKDLFDRRTNIKKEMKKYVNEKGHVLQTDEAEFMWNYYNAKQKAVKVFMNTFYGESGNRLSPFRVLQVSGGITLFAKNAIHTAERIVKKHNAKIYYGDSVSENTPLLLRINGKLCIKLIKDLCKIWKPFNLRKEGSDKEHGFIDAEIWSRSGWTPIIRVIRHKTNKPLFRVKTFSSYVDCTNDHSLINKAGDPVKPLELKYGSALYGTFPNEKFTGWMQSFEVNSSHFHKYSFNDIINLDRDGKLYFLNHYLYNNDLTLTTADIHSHFEYLELSGQPCLQLALYYIIKSLGYKFLNSLYVKSIETPRDEYNIHNVYDLETEDGSFMASTIMMFNTDSLYVSQHHNRFTEVDVLYYTEKINKLDYWTRVVKITMTELQKLRDIINAQFIQETNTGFLRMAYEEVLFPVAFFAKKKYAGIAHEETIEFKTFDEEATKTKIINDLHDKKEELTEEEFQYRVEDNMINALRKTIFIRGLEIIKRGMSNLLREIGLNILYTVFHIDNTKTIMELVQEKIYTIYNLHIDDKLFSKFIKTDVYKPKKRNIKIHRFVERMKIERNIDVKPFDRFKYVLVKKYPYIYGARGCKSLIKVGDKMEFADIAKTEKLQIDLDEYMNGGISGQLARLITYHDDFHVEPVDNNIKLAEEQIYKKACKYISNIVSKYHTKYNDFGKYHKKIYRLSSKIVKSELNDISPFIKKLSAKNDIELLNLKDSIIKSINIKANKMEYSKLYVRKLLKMRSVVQLQQIYYNNKKSVEFLWNTKYSMEKAVLDERLYNSLNKIEFLYSKFTEITDLIINKIKNNIICGNTALIEQDQIDDIFLMNNDMLLSLTKTEVDKYREDFSNNIKEYENIYNRILGLELQNYHITNIIQILKNKRNEKVGYIKQPKIDIEQMVNDSL